MMTFLRKILNDLRSPYMHMQWRLLYSFEQSDVFSLDLKSFKELKPPSDKFWADPFVIKENSRFYLFFEEFDRKENIGYIVSSELNSKGSISKPEIILKKDYHLSYPSIFKHDEYYYMVPESYQNKTISLYKGVNFPNEWEFECNLIENIEASDSSLFFYNNIWYLFTTQRSKLTDDYSDWNELHIYYSDRLEGRWMPHLLNPIYTGLENSRMAGSIFERDCKLYRPAQDNRKRYGHGIIINRIEELTPASFKEIKAVEYYPLNKWMHGCHHIDAVEGLTVIDGEKYCWK